MDEKECLKKKYTSRIYFVEMHRKTNGVCFRDAAGVVIINKWYESRKKQCRGRSRVDCTADSKNNLGTD